MPPVELDFTTKKKDPGKEVSFTLDGVTLVGREPKKSSLLSLASVAGLDDPVQQVNAVMVYIEGMLVPESRAYVFDRLNDPDDDLDYEDLVPIMKGITEALSERPTPPPPASPGRRSQSGRPSTARSRSSASTRAPSPSPAS